MRVFSALRRIRTIHTLNTFPCGLGRREVIGPSVFLLEASGRWSDLVARARRGCRARTGQVGGFVPSGPGRGPPGRDLGEGEPSFRTSTGGAAQRRVGGRDRPFGAAQVEVAPLPPCHAPNCPPMPVPPMPRGCHPPMPHATFPACTAHAGALSMGKAPCGCWHFWGAGAPAPHCAHQRCSAVCVHGGHSARERGGCGGPRWGQAGLWHAALRDPSRGRQAAALQGPCTWAQRAAATTGPPRAPVWRAHSAGHRGQAAAAVAPNAHVKK